MIKAVNCAALGTALEKLKEIVAYNESEGIKTVVFCEDRLSLAAERTVCAAVGGTFLTSVYTFARFLSSETGAPENVLSEQGSAMAIRRIIEQKSGELKLFKRLSATDAAQSVYDTIALLYSSRITAEEVMSAAESGGGVLGGKLHDLSVIYSAYEEYLSANGKQDRNGYLRRLGPVIENSGKIRGNAVVFLGFQAFTCTVTECARAAFAVAKDAYGLFIGGKEDIYVNEASVSFVAAAKDFGGAEIAHETGARTEEAEALRRGLFNPESFYRKKTPTADVRVLEAADAEEEFEFIAASIKKHVLDGGERYAKISVMLPDLDVAERRLSGVFSRYKIPYYADRRLPLSRHPLSGFIINYLSCALSGCRPEDVDGVISSPYFPADDADKDEFRNYCLRLCNYRGGVKKIPNRDIVEALEFDYQSVERVRETFLEGLKLLTENVKSGICAGIRALLRKFGTEKTLKDFAQRFRDEKPTEAQFSARAYESVIKVVDEAESLTDDSVSLKDFIKILKSGFSAMKISLIPPKSDAVFVGDLGTTANTGSNVLFAARLSGDVPGAGADCSLLTDGEIAALEGVNLNISPKIRQVNARKREIIALNICAFRKNLYLSYPVRLDGEESGVSEIIAYAGAIFSTPSGGALKPVEIRKIEKSERAVPYYCSEKLPALKYVRKYAHLPAASSVCEALKQNGCTVELEAAFGDRAKKNITCGKKLYLNYDSISPTTLETYFACPYLGFIRQGLKVREREEGAVRAVDTGNFIHSVLQDAALEVDGAKDGEAFKTRVRAVAEEALKKPPYSSLADSESGRYTAGELLKEAVKVSEGMYEQLKNSKFKVSGAESKCLINLNDGVKIFGRIDRIDESGDMVRIIDYKTGTIDASASKYYTGAKLQLPLYLSAVSEGKRAVGAYYFPAAVEFREKQDGVFRLQGYMDGSDDVVRASDVNVDIKSKSSYVDAYYCGRAVDSAMPREDFKAFLQYSGMVAGQGAEELLSGNVTPSPAKGACDYCKAGGSCGFAAGRDGEERKAPAVKCAEIAGLVKSLKGKTDE